MFSPNRNADEERARARRQQEHDDSRRHRHASSHDLIAAAWPPRGATDDVRAVLRRAIGRRLADGHG